MHCPKCGQQQLSNEIRFCSKCGFLLTGVAEVIGNNGLVPLVSGSPAKPQSSMRKKGVKQGAFIFLMSFLIVPVIVLISVANHMEPTLAILATILLVAGGLLRMVYALMFEADQPAMTGIGEGLPEPSLNFPRTAKPGELQSGVSVPASAYAAPGTGHWRDTSDLAPSSTVTDTTTQLLNREREN